MVRCSNLQLSDVKSFILMFSALLSGFALSAEIANISPQQLLATDTSDWLIVDVRSPDEYASGHVPGAINISHLEIEANLQQLTPFRDKPVVLYCRSGKRAAKAADVLLTHDFSQLKHLQGDMMGWQEEGLNVEK
jgi:phage shock protein E